MELRLRVLTMCGHLFEEAVMSIRYLLSSVLLLLQLLLLLLDYLYQQHKCPLKISKNTLETKQLKAFF